RGDERGVVGPMAAGTSDSDSGEPIADLGEQLVDRMGQLNSRVPLVGKVPPWRQPPKPADPDAPKPFGWLRDLEGSDGPSMSEAVAEGAAQRGSRGLAAARKPGGMSGAAFVTRSNGGEGSIDGLLVARTEQGEALGEAEPRSDVRASV